MLIHLGIPAISEQVSTYWGAAIFYVNFSSWKNCKTRQIRSLIETYCIHCVISVQSNITCICWCFFLYSQERCPLAATYYKFIHNCIKFHLETGNLFFFSWQIYCWQFLFQVPYLFIYLFRCINNKELCNDEQNQCKSAKLIKLVF